MKKIQPRLVKGSRDFLPDQVSRRRYLLDTIREVFERYSFQEIETPAMELLETLTGKYGEEGDKLLFRILNSGDFLKGTDPELAASGDSRALGARIAEKGLRYDLTVPLARYVVQHRNELTFPFRRFHIGPVWRADRPQRGRYREFYQCDADIIGSTSILNEAELTSVLLDTFDRLGLEVTIEVNHRRILESIVEKAGLKDQYKDILIAIDKLDKAEKEKVAEELHGKGIQHRDIDMLFDLFAMTDLRALAGHLGAEHEGIADLERLLKLTGSDRVQFSAALARGLDYYTGTIWEVKAAGVNMGTIAAGGRYDDLTGLFGGQNLSGVGISFGVERIYDILEETGGFPENIAAPARVLIINFGGESEAAGWSLLKDLRASGLPSEIYPSAAKLKKQMSYADRKRIPYVIFIGEEELAAGKIQLKDMTTGDQQTFVRKNLTALLAALDG
jgi:histidyl-tRNA synthetase